MKLFWELNLKTRRLTVHRQGRSPQFLSVEDTLSGEEVLPGFTLPLRPILSSLTEATETEEDSSAL